MKHSSGTYYKAGSGMFQQKLSLWDMDTNNKNLKACKALVVIAFLLSLVALFGVLFAYVSGKPRTYSKGKLKLSIIRSAGYVDFVAAALSLASWVCFLEFAREAKGAGFAFNCLSTGTGIFLFVFSIVVGKCEFVDSDVGAPRVKSWKAKEGEDPVDDVETGTRRGSRQRVSTTVNSEVSDRSVPASAARVSKAGGKGERSKRLQAYVM